MHSIISPLSSLPFFLSLSQDLHHSSLLLSITLPSCTLISISIMLYIFKPYVLCTKFLYRSMTSRCVDQIKLYKKKYNLTFFPLTPPSPVLSVSLLSLYSFSPSFTLRLSVSLSSLEHFKFMSEGLRA